MAMLRAEIPSELKQRFVLEDPKEYAHVNLFFRNEGKQKSKFLYTSSGEFADLVACYAGPLVIVHKTSCGHDGTYSHSQWRHYSLAEEDASIIDVAYLPTTDGRLGLALVARVEGGSKVLRIIEVHGMLVDVYTHYFQSELTCIMTALDNKETVEERPRIHRKMAEWPNVVVIGGRRAVCHLCYLPDDDTEDNKVPMTDGLRAFHTKKGFLYQFTHELETRTRMYDMDLAEVTALGYNHFSRDIFIGFKFGGTMKISISENPLIDGLPPIRDGPVQGFACLQPDDDPRYFLWTWIIQGNSPRPNRANILTAILYQGVVPEEDQLPLEERKFNRPIWVAHNIHEIRGSKWVSIRTLTREKTMNREDTAANTPAFCHLFTKDRSLALLTYMADGKFMGSIYDLNAHYYKRLTTSVDPDRTIARQCPFMSNIFPCEALSSSEDFMDVAVDVDSIERFRSMVSENEQMFYPSALDIQQIFVSSATGFRKMKLPCIIQQLVTRLTEDNGAMIMSLNEPGRASAFIQALGLFPDQSRKDPFDAVMALAVYYNQHDSLVKAIRGLTDYSLLIRIYDWMWQEVQSAKDKMNEIVAPLFSKISIPLTPASYKSFAAVMRVLIASVSVLKVVETVMNTIQEVPREVVAECKLRLSASTNLRHSVQIHRNLIDLEILPFTEDSKKIRSTLHEMVHQRQIAALHEGKKLFIDHVLTTMRRLTPSEPFWMSQNVAQWYPPALSNLIEVIPLISIPSKTKKQLLIYFAFDYLVARDLSKMEDQGEHQDLTILAKRTNIHNSVGSMLFNVFGINMQDVQELQKKWNSDCSSETNGEHKTAVMPSVCSNEKLADQLMEAGRTKPLNASDESKLKELLISQPFGQFRWQVYLMGQLRYKEVDLTLKVPADCSNWYIDAYQMILPVARARVEEEKKGQDVVQKIRKQLNISDDFVELIKKATQQELSQTPARQPVQQSKLLPRTPMPLYKNIRQPGRSIANNDSALSQPTVSQDDTLEDRLKGPAAVPVLFSTPDNSISDMPSEMVNRVNDILRTPTSRARAAAAAEAQISIDTTPETKATIPEPTSILKSTKSASKQRVPDGTPSRMLRFDLPDSDEGTLMSSALETPENRVHTTSFEQQGDESMEPTQRNNASLENNDSVQIIGESSASPALTSMSEDIVPDFSSAAVPQESVIRMEEEQGDNEDGNGSADNDVDQINTNETFVVSKPVKFIEEQENIVDEPSTSYSPVREENNEMDAEEIIPVEVESPSPSGSSVLQPLNGTYVVRSSESEQQELTHRRWIDREGIEHSFEQQPDTDDSDQQPDIEEPIKEPQEQAQTSPQIPDETITEALSVTQPVGKPPVPPVERRRRRVSEINSSLGPIDRTRSRGRRPITVEPTTPQKEVEKDMSDETVLKETIPRLRARSTSRQRKESETAVNEVVEKQQAARARSSSRTRKPTPTESVEAEATNTPARASRSSTRVRASSATTPVQPMPITETPRSRSSSRTRMTIDEQQPTGMRSRSSSRTRKSSESVPVEVPASSAKRRGRPIALVLEDDEKVETVESKSPGRRGRKSAKSVEEPKAETVEPKSPGRRTRKPSGNVDEPKPKEVVEPKSPGRRTRKGSESIDETKPKEPATPRRTRGSSSAPAIDASPARTNTTSTRGKKRGIALFDSLLKEKDAKKREPRKRSVSDTDATIKIPAKTTKLTEPIPEVDEEASISTVRLRRTPSRSKKDINYADVEMPSTPRPRRSASRTAQK